MMLQVVPTHWYSSNFTVSQASEPVADGDVSWWREKGELRVEGVRYDVYREGWMNGTFVLERNGSVIARAEKPSAFFRRYLIRHGDREYTLDARTAFRRAFALLDGTREIGSIEPTSALTRDAIANLPDSWPLPIRAFVICPVEAGQKLNAVNRCRTSTRSRTPRRRARSRCPRHRPRAARVVIDDNADGRPARVAVAFIEESGQHMPYCPACPGGSEFS